MAESLVSVIVPIYNIEEFVCRCVRSIQQQTFANLEIILVDDGSTDQSGAICDELAVEDHRVRVIHKLNGGLSDARNVGLRAASGELITLIDGDDYVAADYIENLLRPFGDVNVDISVSGFEKVLPEADTESSGGNCVAYSVMSRDEGLTRLFYQKGITTSAWGKMYRSVLFEGVDYPVGEIHEDLPVTYQLLNKARMLAVVDSKDYYYVQHGNSITAQKNIERRMPALGFAAEAVQFFEGEEALRAAAQSRLFMEAVYIVSQVDALGKLKRLNPKVGEVVRENRSAVLKSEAPLPQKALAATSILGKYAIWVVMKIRVCQNEVRLRK